MVDFKNEIKLAFVENKKAIIVSIAVLIISLILGYFLKPYLYDFLNPVVENLTDKVKSGVIELTFQSIFFNNIRVVLMSFVFGLLFCFSTLILAFNGFFAGYYVAYYGDLFKVSLLIVPHGIFEFSSCILSCASGIVLFHFVCKFLKKLFEKSDNSISEKFSNAFDFSFDKLKQALILLIISSILMAIAGFVEVYLTLPIANFVMSLF